MKLIFDTMAEAYTSIEVALRDAAASASENGAPGLEHSSQAFTVAGAAYTGILDVTYDRTSRPYAFVTDMAYRVEDAAHNVIQRPAEPPQFVEEAKP